MLKRMLIFILILAVTGLFADRIILQNQNVLEGMIVSEDDESIVMRTAVGELTLNRNNIAEIQREELDISYQRLADQYFERRDYQRAADYYEQAYRINSLNTEARERLEETRQILEEEQARTHERLQERINQRLRSLDNFQSNSDFEELLQYLQSLLDRRDTPESIRASIRNSLPEVHMAFADFLLDRMNKMYAIDQLEKALELDANLQEARKLLADLYATESTTMRKAMELFKELYEETGETEYLRRIVTLSERFNLLLDNFKYVKAYYEEEADSTLAQRAYSNSLEVSLRDFQRRNNYEGMRRIYQEMEKMGQEVDPMEYTKIDFQLKARQASLDDIPAIMEASRFARENNLISQGFNLVRRYYQQNRSNENLQQEYYEYAELMLTQAQQALEQGNFEESIRLANNIREYFPDFEKKDAVSSILHRAELQREREKEAIRDRALRLAQRGDDYYRRGLSYMQQLRRTDYQVTHFDNPYREAISWMQRARDMYQQAMQLDPELAYPEYADLRTKITDVHYKLTELHNMRRLPSFYRIESHDYTDPYYDDYDDYDDEMDYDR